MDIESRNEMALGWAEMRFQRDDIMGAKEVLDNYVEMDGENVFSYLIKGVLAFSERDTLSAYEHFKDAYELDPTSEVAINSNIGFAQLVGDYDHVMHVYQTADWSVVNAGQMVSTFNQIALQYNRMEEHDSAMVVIQRAIAVDTLRSTPYTTLAETLYFQGHVDSFYYYTEKALQLGFNTQFYDYDEAPYDYFENQLEFQRLLKKYRKEGNELLSD
jgi:Tfp pilus assembly protein PilF